VLNSINDASMFLNILHEQHYNLYAQNDAFLHKWT